MATAINNKQEPAIPRSALVVDDSKIARNVLSKALVNFGYHVDTTHSAESALKQLAGPLPDVVFMDHLLPGIEGLEAVRRLRKQPRTARLPIIMYTSQESDEFAATARQTGAEIVPCKRSLLDAERSEVLEGRLPHGVCLLPDRDGR